MEPIERYDIKDDYLEEIFEQDKLEDTEEEDDDED